jgi:hypothetical protein
MDSQEKTLYKALLKHVSNASILEEVESRLNKKEIGVGVIEEKNRIVLLVLKGEKFSIEGDLSKSGIVLQKKGAATRNDSSKHQIPCCLLREMSEAIRDYVYMQGSNNSNYNMKFLTI